MEASDRADAGVAATRPPRAGGGQGNFCFLPAGLRAMLGERRARRATGGRAMPDFVYDIPLRQLAIYFALIAVAAMVVGHPGRSSRSCGS